VPSFAQDKIGSTTGVQAQAGTGSTQSCATSWTTVDADESGTISGEEASAATDAEFSRIDVNGDGTISVAEWKHCGDRAAYPGVPRGLQSAATGSDAVNENRMAASSDQVATDASPGVEGMTTSPASDQAKADLEIEVDEAGGTTEESGQAPGAAAFGEAEGVPPWSQAEFDAADADQSGDISEQEAAEADASRLHQAGGSAEVQARLGSAGFARLDSDGNGKITEDEFASRNQADVDAMADARFGKLDADGNGEVSRDEWTQHRGERFSQAQQSAGEEPTVWIYYYYVR
jgi:Ca2+-binding EF-hand superfamily protein